MSALLDRLSIYWDRRVLALTALGVSCGLPWSLTHSTLTYWLTQEGVSMKVVGLFALASLPYTLKFLWAPLFDRYRLPLIGRFGQKQGWMIGSQLGLTMCLWMMANVDPHSALSYLALLTILTSFFAASQDIAVDGWRVEVLEDDEQGVGASVATFGYRVGMYLSSAGAILLSVYASWRVIYMSLALLCLGGALVSVWSGRLIERSSEPDESSASATSQLKPLPPPWVRVALLGCLALPVGLLIGSLCNEDPQNPFAIFGVTSAQWTWVESSLLYAKGQVKLAVGVLMFVIVSYLALRKRGLSDLSEGEGIAGQGARFLREHWLLVLGLIMTFRLGDHLLSFFLYPSLHQLGFDEIEIASVAKTWGLIATFIGTFFGGWLVYRVGLMRAMVISGIAQLLSNLTLSAQALLGDPEVLTSVQSGLSSLPLIADWLRGHEQLAFLYVSIGAQDIALGMVNATFVAYLSSLCDRRAAASHFAFFTALSSLLKSFVQAGSGELADYCQASWGLHYGWAAYFAYTSLVAAPGLILLLVITRVERREQLRDGITQP